MDHTTYTMDAVVQASDLDGECAATLLSLLSLTQNLASFHYGTGGLSIPHLQQKNMTWIIVKQRIEIAEYPLWLDRLSCATWAKPVRGLFCNRDFAFSYAPGGKNASVNAAIGLSDRRIDQPRSPFLRGTTCWLVADTNTGKPLRPDPAMFGTLPFRDEDSLPSDFPRFGLPEDFSPAVNTAHTEASLCPTVLDIDMNGHVNNLNYVRWILSFTPAGIFREKRVSRLDTYYVTPAKFGDALLCRTAVVQDGGPDGETGCIHSIARAGDGTEVFRARTLWLPASRMTRKLTID
ncbi:MAG: hypothetical protein LBR23_00410 [Spirochaetaceae bacterium]|nr:hypothetical protein [Spirochaetaceae bacterium]